jgi:hypothetical protein
LPELPGAAALLAIPAIAPIAAHAPAAPSFFSLEWVIDGSPLS